MTVFTSHVATLTLALRQAATPILAKLLMVSTSNPMVADYCRVKVCEVDPCDAEFEDLLILICQNLETNEAGRTCFKSDSVFTTEFEGRVYRIIDGDSWRGEIVKYLLCDSHLKSDYFETDSLIDVYTSDLTAWLAADINRVSRIDEVYESYEPESLATALRIGQDLEIQEIASELRFWLLEVWSDFQDAFEEAQEAQEAAVVEWAEEIVAQMSEDDLEGYEASRDSWRDGVGIMVWPEGLQPTLHNLNEVMTAIDELVL